MIQFVQMTFSLHTSLQKTEMPIKEPGVEGEGGTGAIYLGPNFTYTAPGARVWGLHH